MSGYGLAYKSTMCSSNLYRFKIYSNSNIQEKLKIKLQSPWCMFLFPRNISPRYYSS